MFAGSYIYIDETDCRIQESSLFSSCCYSQKFRGPGLQYEVGIIYMCGEIVWVYGPFLCGMWQVVEILKKKLVPVLQAQETVVIDNAYRHTWCINEDKVPALDKPLHR